MPQTRFFKGEFDRDAGGCIGEARQAGDLQHGSRLAVHRRSIHRRADRKRDRHQHGRQGRLARQRLRRAAVAQRQIRGGVSAEPTTASARRAHRSAATSTSTIAADRIRALTARHPIKPTSTRCPSAWQPNPGRGSTYRRGNSVQTTGTTSPGFRPAPGRTPPLAIEKIEKLSDYAVDCTTQSTLGGINGNEGLPCVQREMQMLEL